MLFSPAVIGKKNGGRRAKEGWRRIFGRCYVAMWCQGSCEAWQRGERSHPQLLFAVEKGGKRVRGERRREVNGKTASCEAIRGHTPGTIQPSITLRGESKAKRVTRFQRSPWHLRFTVSLRTRSPEMTTLQNIFITGVNKPRHPVLLGFHTAADPRWLTMIQCCSAPRGWRANAWKGVFQKPVMFISNVLVCHSFRSESKRKKWLFPSLSNTKAESKVKNQQLK